MRLLASKKDGRYQQTDSINDKYIVNLETKNVNIFGKERPWVTGCEVYSERVECEQTHAEFVMHRSNMKFMLFFKTYGYLWDDPDDTPHMAIGTCAKF